MMDRRMVGKASLIVGLIVSALFVDHVNARYDLREAHDIQHKSNDAF